LRTVLNLVAEHTIRFFVKKISGCLTRVMGKDSLQFREKDRKS
jgi:hypothetical protein